MKPMKEIVLEISLKPFLRRKAESYGKTAEELFRQWRPLWDGAERLSVMLWTGDGSEILEFGGEMEKTFDWGRYIGVINDKQTPQQKKDDPERRHAFTTGKVFETGTKKLDYATLKEIVSSIKKTGAEEFGREISIGTIFDPGPEFAVSEFKYRKHPEICLGGYVENRKDVVSCYSKLHADAESYAGFPHGIPEGTPFGRFFGRQCSAFLKAMDMDFIWLSNGFGFGNFAWQFPGVLYDGEKFMPEKGEGTHGQMLEFWREFRAEYKGPVAVRGSNLSAGRDIACDGVPLREIYETGDLTAPPVNSPWAPLNKDFGSEICGWMSHFAGFPKEDFTFRYYVNDPWFPTKPYLLNYQKEPYDIYVPLAVSRLDAKGETITPSRINILTVDDCQGELPREATESLIPHLKQARRDAPDEPGPLLWLYPFDEYHAWTFKRPFRNEEVFAEDLFIRDAINAGLPLNTVVDTKDCGPVPTGRIAVSPVPEADSKWEGVLLEHAKSGGGVLLYGPLDHASKKLLELLGVELAEALSGDFSVESDYLPERSAGSRKIRHEALYSAGGIRESGAKSALATLRAENGGAERVLAAEAKTGKGRIVWLRTSAFRCHAFSVSDEYERVKPRQDLVEVAAMARRLLSRFGWGFEYDLHDENGWVPVNALSRHENAFMLSGCNLSTTTEHRLKSPFGAPALLGQDFILEGDEARYRFGRSYHAECRVFVEQPGKGVVSCYEGTPALRDVSRWIWLRNVKDALVRIFPPRASIGSLEVQIVTPERNFTNPPRRVRWTPVEENGFTYCVLNEKVSGQILVYWS